MQIHFDLPSILWFNSFALNLHESLMRTSVGSPLASQEGSISSHTFVENGLNNQQEQEPSLMYMDVKLEAIMPRIIIESAVETPNQKDRPKIMQIQISRFAITNIRELGSSRADLAQALSSLQEGSLVFGSGFPSSDKDMCIVTDRILAHVAAADITEQNAAGSMFDSPQMPIKSASTQNLSRYAMWSEPRDVWCIKLDPVWIDFLGARSLGPNKSIPFVDAVPITLWLHAGNDSAGAVASSPTSTATTSKPTNQSVSDGLGYTALSEFYVETNAAAKPRNPFLSSDEDVHQLPTAGAGVPAATESTSALNADRTADMHAIGHISNLVSVQIDHYQFLFLLRLAEEMNEMTTFLSMDAERILQKVNLNK